MGERIQFPNAEGVTLTVPAWDFLNDSPTYTGSSLSAHALILPDGSIIRCVRDQDVAFHAGHSRFGLLENLNTTFLGVELLLPGTWNITKFNAAMRSGVPAYTDEQYASLDWLVQEWKGLHGFTMSWVVGHSDVASDEIRGPGRGKRDPGEGFDWVLDVV
jgi:N-acetylmuramoyl-L-alanine amidase